MSSSDNIDIKEESDAVRASTFKLRTSRDDKVPFRKQFRERSSDKSSLNSLRDKLKERETEIDSLNDELIDIGQKFRREKKNLKHELLIKKNELHEVEEDLKAEIQVSTKYKLKNKELERKIIDLVEDFERQKDEIARKDKKIAELHAASGEEHQKLDEENQSIKENMENEINRLQGIINGLFLEKEEFQAKNEKSETAKERLKNKIDQLKETNESLNKKIDEQNSTEESLKKDNETLTETNKQLLLLINGEKSTNEELHSLLKNQQLSLQEHKMKIESLERESIASSTSSRRYSSRETVTPILETVTKKETIATSVTPVISEETAACPNCSLMIGVSLLEKHLEMCLEQF